MDILSIVIELLVGVVVGMFLEWGKKKRRLSVEVQRYQNISDANFATVLEVLKQLAVAALDKDKVQKRYKIALCGMQIPKTPRLPLEMEVTVMTNLWNSPHNPFLFSKSSLSDRNKNRPETIDEIINTFRDTVQKIVRGTTF